MFTSIGIYSIIVSRCPKLSQEVAQNYAHKLNEEDLTVEELNNFSDADWIALSTKNTLKAGHYKTLQFAFSKMINS